MLQCVAMCCSMLQCVAVCCISGDKRAVRCVAVRCIVLQYRHTSSQLVDLRNVGLCSWAYNKQDVGLQQVDLCVVCLFVCLVCWFVCVWCDCVWCDCECVIGA